jgi:hypothetical protein
MGKKIDKVIGSKADRTKLKNARADLEKVGDRQKADAKRTGIPASDTDPSYRAANQAVADAEKDLPYLGRW